jgi:alkylhydroperoxidase/carboxymuconolactone decarboxylase family protein YurZ
MKKKAPDRIPTHFTKFVKDFPKVAASYGTLSKACKSAGPLNKKTAALVKLGVAIGSKREGAVHSHTRKCLEAGAREREIRHAVILALTTIGFPSMMAALSWVNDVLEQQ